MPEEALTVTIRLKDFATRGMRKFHGTVTRVAAKVRAKLMAVKSAVFGLKGALIALGGTMVARSFIDAGAQLEKFRTQLIAVMGQNEELADSTLAWVREFAKLTPHATADVIQAFVSLQAAGVNANKQMMDTLGNVAYVFDRNIADVSLGLVSMEKEIFKRLGIQWEIVGKKAKIWSGDTIVHTNKAAESMREGILEIWEKKFPGAMKRAEGDYRGLMELLKSQWWEFRAQVMKAGVMDFLKGGLAHAAKSMGGMEKAAPKFAKSLVEGMKKAVLYGARLADGFTVTRKTWNIFQQAVLVARANLEETRGQLKRLFGDSSERDANEKYLTDTEMALRNIREEGDKIGGEDSAFAKAAKWLSDMEDGSWGVKQAIVEATEAQKEFNAALFGRMVKPYREIREQAERAKKAWASVYTAEQVGVMNDAAKAARDKAAAELEAADVQHTMLLNYEMLRDIERDIADAAEETNQKLREQKTIFEDTRPQYEAIRIQFETYAHILGDSIVGAIDNAIEGTFRWQDALKGLLKDLALAMTRMLIMQGIGAIGGAISGAGTAVTSYGTGMQQSASPLAKGGYVGRGVNIPRAQKGRVINGPQMILAGDNTTGDNEEYIMPAVKGPDGTLGVKGHGGGVTINVSAVDEDGVAKFFYKHRDKLMSMFNLGMTESPGMTPAGG